MRFMNTPDRNHKEAEVRKREMRKLLKLGHSKAKIARLYGISRQRVHQLLGAK